MAKNAALGKAKDAKQDEFYTQLADIENELRHYRPHFKGKTILCNCDDPYESNFFKYFALNFNKLKLKKLIATCYAGSPITGTQLSLFGDETDDERRTPYKVVVANPPFSLIREYITTLIEHEKSFVVIAPQSATKYKETFPLIRGNKMWLGYNSGDMAFCVPDDYEPRETRYWQDRRSGTAPSPTAGSSRSTSG